MLLTCRKSCVELFVYQMDPDARLLQYETSKILYISIRTNEFDMWHLSLESNELMMDGFQIKVARKKLAWHLLVAPRCLGDKIAVESFVDDVMIRRFTTHLCLIHKQ